MRGASFARTMQLYRFASMPVSMVSYRGRAAVALAVAQTPGATFPRCVRQWRKRPGWKLAA